MTPEAEQWRDLAERLLVTLNATLELVEAENARVRGVLDAAREQLGRLADERARIDRQ